MLHLASLHLSLLLASSVFQLQMQLANLLECPQPPSPASSVDMDQLGLYQNTEEV
jgi:hypothetical protein